MTDLTICVHRFAFDGDDPYIICDLCGETRDALTGRVIREGVME